MSPILVAIIALAAVVVWLLAVWLATAGDREQDIVDEEPTLDVQNHKGD